ncbi:MAG: major capsid protein, partial [Planctomycetales bacterium]|nr:major capsid protein [Planctomycetales bacterium]
YIGLQILPRFNVPRQSGKFGRIPIDQLLAAGKEKLERAARSGFKRSDWEFAEDSYSTTERGAEEPIDDREAALYADYFDAETVAAQRAIERLYSDYERRIIALAIDANVTAGRETAAAATWDTNTGSPLSDPRGDVRTGAKAIWARTGMWPNTLVISQQTFETLQDNHQVIERITSNGAGASALPDDITLKALAQFFSIQQVLVAKAIQLSSGDVVSSLFPDDSALLLKAARGNDIQAPAFGRTFVYDGVVGSTEADGVTSVPETYREENIKSTIVRVGQESDEKVLYPELAEVITGIA